MKSGTRNIIICAACAAVLGGTVAVLSLSGGGSPSSSSASSTASIELVSKKNEDVASMKVTNKKGSYTLVPIQAASASSSSTDLTSGSSSSESSSVTYTVQELGGCPIDTSETGTVVKNGFSLVATKNLGTVSNLQDYGLKDPQATVNVSFKDGSSFNYKIGSATVADSSSYYMCAENSSNVYVASVDAGLLEDAKYFVSKQILSIVDSSSNGANSSADFDRITFSGSNFPQAVKLEKSGDELAVTSPLKCDADTDTLGTVETALTSLTAESVAAVNTDAASLKAYGLDKPVTVAEYTVNKKSYKLMVGAKKDKDYYVMLDGVNVVYNVAADNISSLAQLSPFGIRSKMILVPNITTVKSIEFNSNGKTDTVNVTRTENTASSTEKQKVYNYKVTGDNSKQLDYDKNYKNLYGKVISITLLNQTDQKPSGSPVFTVKYSYFDKPGTDTVEFYKTDTRRYTATVNGTVYGVVVSDGVDSAIQYVTKFENGETIPES